MGNSKHSVSVAGVIVNDENKVLIIQRNDNFEWQIPGGVLELDECIHTGLEREIFEETGIQIDVLGLTGIYKNLKVGVVALVFKCKFLSGFPTTSEETKTVTWLTIDEAYMLLNNTFKVRLKDAIEYNGFASVRNHDGINFFNTNEKKSGE